MGCGVEDKTRSTLRWGGHIEKMRNEEFVKKVYLSKMEGTNRRRPLRRWKDRVKAYVRVNELEWVRRVCMDRGRWRSICFWREQGVRATD